MPLPAGQALYGGGSYQNGLVNYKGVPFLQHVAVSMDELTHLPRGKWQIMEKHQKPDLCFFFPVNIWIMFFFFWGRGGISSCQLSLNGQVSPIFQKYLEILVRSHGVHIIHDFSSFPSFLRILYFHIDQSPAVPI